MNNTDITNTTKNTKLITHINNTVAFTGHRELPPNSLNIRKSLHNTLTYYINMGYHTFLCGMAMGFDLLCGEEVVKLKENYPNVRLVLCIPCTNQDYYFSAIDKKRYSFLIENCDDTIFISKNCTKEAMLKRNRFMVDNCNLVIAYKARDFGGTAYTINYALRKGVEVVNIYDLFKTV